MKILIVNAYGQNQDDIFSKLEKIIKNLFVTQKELLDTETEFYVVDRDKLEDFLFEPDSFFSSRDAARLFDFIDIVIIEGDENLRPWSQSALKLMVLFRMCMRSNKLLFASGIGLQALIFLVASNSEVHLTMINGPNGCKLGDLSNMKKEVNVLKPNECFLDNVTGDIYQYITENYQWVSKGNIGIHSRIAAEQQGTIGKYVVKAPQYRPKTAKNESIYTSTNNEVVCYLKKQNLQHYLFESLPQKFVVNAKHNWDVHPFNFVNPMKRFTTIAESEKGPMIIEISENIIGTQFRIEKKYQETVKILENFIRHQLQKIRCGSLKTNPIVIATVQLDKEEQDAAQNGDPNQKQLKFSLLTKFHHSGFAAKKSQIQGVVENNAIVNETSEQTQKHFSKRAQSGTIRPVSKYSINENVTNNNILSNINFSQHEENHYLFDKNQQEVRQMLHPMIKKNGLPEVSQVMRSILHKTKIDATVMTSNNNSTAALKTMPRKFSANLITKPNFRHQEYEDFDQCRLQPFVRCSSPYTTVIETMRKSELEESKKNIGSNKLNFSKPNLNYIPNYVNQTPSEPPLLHKFREVNSQKWIGKKNFKLS